MSETEPLSDVHQETVADNKVHHEEVHHEEESSIHHHHRSTPRKAALRVLLIICLAALWFAVTELWTRSGLEQASEWETKTSKQPHTAAVVEVAHSQNASLQDTATRSKTNDRNSTNSSASSPPITTINATKVGNTSNPNTTINSDAETDTHHSSKDRLVISMKTMPSRIANIQPTLDSLLFQQTIHFDAFYLSLPEQPPNAPAYIIPPFLQDYIHQGLVTVLKPSYDYGAIDKMIHTLPAEETIFQSQTTLQACQFRILYLDDDMIYDPRHVEILANKSEQYPHDVVALSGTKLRSHFRQIAHTNPAKDRHPYLFYYLGGLDSFGDAMVDIVQGFMGVLVRLSFFNVSEFVSMAVGGHNIPDPVRRSDDFAICGYLAYRNVTRRCVDGGLVPVVHKEAASVGNLGKTMNQNAMGAASYLQSQWGIWQNYTFVDYQHLSESIQDMILCEAGRVQNCAAVWKDSSGKPLISNVTARLDQLLNVTSATKNNR